MCKIEKVRNHARHRCVFGWRGKKPFDIAVILYILYCMCMVNMAMATVNITSGQGTMSLFI